MVPQVGGPLELLLLGRLLHHLADSFAGRPVAAPEEVGGVPHLAGVGLVVHLTDAGGGAEPDMEVEAGPVGELLAVPDAKEGADQPHRLLDLHVGEGAEVAGAVVPQSADDGDPGIGLVGELEVGVALVIGEADVEGCPVELDEAGLQDQGLPLVGGDDVVQPPGRAEESGHHVLPEPALMGGGKVAAHPLPQAHGLAHVEHLALTVLEEIDPGRPGEPGRLLPEGV